MPLRKEISVVGHLDCPILQRLWLSLTIRRNNFSFLNELIIMRVVAENTLLRSGSYHLGQVVHVVGQQEGLELVGGDLLRGSDKQVQVDLKK